jgi:hypothetical protein
MTTGLAIGCAAVAIEVLMAAVRPLHRNARAVRQCWRLGLDHAFRVSQPEAHPDNSVMAARRRECGAKRREKTKPRK